MGLKIRLSLLCSVYQGHEKHACFSRASAPFTTIATIGVTRVKKYAFSRSDSMRVKPHVEIPKSSNLSLEGEPSGFGRCCPITFVLLQMKYIYDSDFALLEIMASDMDNHFRFSLSGFL